MNEQLLADLTKVHLDMSQGATYATEYLLPLLSRVLDDAVLAPAVALPAEPAIPAPDATSTAAPLADAEPLTDLHGEPVVQR